MYLKIPLEGGGSFVVEAADGPGAIRAARGDRTITTSAETFERSLNTVRHVAETLVRKIASVSVTPDRIRAEFGITLSAETGFVVAKGRGEANFVIELEWTGDSTRSAPRPSATVAVSEPGPGEARESLSATQ